MARLSRVTTKSVGFGVRLPVDGAGWLATAGIIMLLVASFALVHRLWPALLALGLYVLAARFLSAEGR